jgi:hypothetical protein
MRLVAPVFVVILAMFLGCGSSPGGRGDGGSLDADPAAPDASPAAHDADPNPPDADPSAPPGCDPLGPQCNNCVDDDEDGFVDGMDPECTGPSDDREDSYATGIPGDNIDEVFQDCFFDGNSGHEDDGCQIPTCCLTQAGQPGCPPGAPPTLTCEPTQECVDNCEILVPPGCDCFGCCTICNDEGCYDVAIGLSGAECTTETLADPEKCIPCTWNDDCGEPCDPEGCILCPGQTEDDLPPECTDQVCPDGTPPCGGNADCDEGMYCSNGCCIHIIG